MQSHQQRYLWIVWRTRRRRMELVVQHHSDKHGRQQLLEWARWWRIYRWRLHGKTLTERSFLQDNSATAGTSLLTRSASVRYQLPAPFGHYVHAERCIFNREACPLIPERVQSKGHNVNLTIMVPDPECVEIRSFCEREPLDNASFTLNNSTMCPRINTQRCNCWRGAHAALAPW